MRASWPGIGISMIRSKRPGRRRASSRMSGRFVAPMIFTSPRGLKPSSSASSCMSVRWTSRSPDVAISRRFAPTESSSSMNTMEGDFSRASWKSSRTSRAPSPMYFWTSSDPTNRMNVACVRLFAILALSFVPALRNLRLVGFGVATHLLLDLIWFQPAVVLYPAYGWTFPPAPFNVDRWFDTLLHDPYVQIGEIVGFVALIAFAWAHGIRSWKTLRDFIAHGTLPLFGLVQLQKD